MLHVYVLSAIVSLPASVNIVLHMPSSTESYECAALRNIGLVYFVPSGSRWWTHYKEGNYVDKTTTFLKNGPTVPPVFLFTKGLPILSKPTAYGASCLNSFKYLVHEIRVIPRIGKCMGNQVYLSAFKVRSNTRTNHSPIRAGRSVLASHPLHRIFIPCPIRFWY